MTAEADDRILLQAVAVLARRAVACVDVVRDVDATPDERQAECDRLWRTARAAERIADLIDTPDVAAAAQRGPLRAIRSGEADPAVATRYAAGQSLCFFFEPISQPVSTSPRGRRRRPGPPTQPLGNVPTMTTDALTTLTLDAPIAAVAAALRAAGPGVEIPLLCYAPGWTFAVGLLEPDPIPEAGRISERMVRVEAIAYVDAPIDAHTRLATVRPAWLADAGVMGECMHDHWGVADGDEPVRYRFVHCPGRTLSEAVEVALGMLLDVAAKAARHHAARTQAVEHEIARYADALAR